MKLKSLIINLIIIQTMVILVACNESPSISKPSVDTAAKMCADKDNKMFVASGSEKTLYSVLKNNESDNIWDIEIKIQYRTVNLGSGGSVQQRFLDCEYNSEERSVVKVKLRR